MMLSCSLMRLLILVSAALLAAGGLLLIVAEATGWLFPALPLSLPLVLSAPLLLGMALSIALMPNRSARCH